MKKRKFKFHVCKPCWELHYCPYGPLVEYYPLVGVTGAIDSTRVARAENEYRKILKQLANGELKAEHEIVTAAENLEFFYPQRWKDMEQYDCSELECNYVGHICPVFFNAERFTETREVRRLTRHISREMMLKVVRRDGHVCQICNRNVQDAELQFDHIIPVSKGGPTSVSNLRVTCPDCNREKGDSVDEILDSKRPGSPLLPALIEKTKD